MLGIILSLALAGCANRDQAPSTPVVEEPTAALGDWFCQPAVPGAKEPWECVQDENLAANPKPDRLPNAKEEESPSWNRSSLDADPLDPPPLVEGDLPPLPDMPAPPPPPSSELDPLEDQLEEALEEPLEDQPEVQSVDPPAPSLAANVRATPTNTRSNNPTQATNRRSGSSPQGQANKQRGVPDYIRLAYQPKAPISILELPGSYYAVQLAALSTAKKIQSFISKHELKNLTAAKVAAGNKVRYVLILGIYDSREKAEVAAADRLPAPLAGFTPWIRKLSNLQQAMRDAEA